MIPRLYPAEEETFASFGDSLNDCITCEVSEERNGEYVLYMEYPQGGIHGKEIEIDKIILAKPRDGAEEPEPFRITDISASINGAYVINAEPNGTNINKDAGSTHIEVLQKFVVDNGLDVGFAYDGDADRCLCVDEKGNIITGDHILYIYGKYMKERGKLLMNTVVTTVMSNFGLYKAFDELGIEYAKTKVGDNKTPEGEFVIENIHNSSSWTHDFGDGKGWIPNCYGNWFIRLKTPPHRGIGIHGTHAPESIGTRATEGCIRLRNADLDSLKPMVKVGMPVVILPSDADREADAK